jgi:hypothetical protein
MGNVTGNRKLGAHMRIPPFKMPRRLDRVIRRKLTAQGLTELLQLPGLMRPKSFALSFRAKREILGIQSV